MTSSTNGESSLSRQAIPIELVTNSSTRIPVRARVLGQRGPGFEVSRDGVEVATAAGSLPRDSTSAISWSPNSLFSIRVVRRSDVKRNPALMANPIARQFSVLNRLIYGDLD
jgi:hypothetical protein